jgi:hypothetical protein
LETEDNFLKSTRQESISEYQISSDNSQKDNFHNAFYRLTYPTFSDIRNVRWGPLR